MCTDGYGEDYGLDGWLEDNFEYNEPYMGEDYNIFEENQLALDREHELDYYEDDEIDPDEYTAEDLDDLYQDEKDHAEYFGLDAEPPF